MHSVRETPSPTLAGKKAAWASPIPAPGAAVSSTKDTFMAGVGSRLMDRIRDAEHDLLPGVDATSHHAASDVNDDRVLAAFSPAKPLPSRASSERMDIFTPDRVQLSRAGRAARSPKDDDETRAAVGRAVLCGVRQQRVVARGGGWHAVHVHAFVIALRG
jgi:hypothetical protein